MGDLPSLSEDTQPATVPARDLQPPTEHIEPASATADLPSLSENTRPEPLPADNLPALAEDMHSARPAPDANPTSGWSDLIQMSWSWRHSRP